MLLRPLFLSLFLYFFLSVFLFPPSLLKKQHNQILTCNFWTILTTVLLFKIPQCHNDLIFILGSKYFLPHSVVSSCAGVVRAKILDPREPLLLEPLRPRKVTPVFCVSEHLTGCFDFRWCLRELSKGVEEVLRPDPQFEWQKIEISRLKSWLGRINCPLITADD